MDAREEHAQAVALAVQEVQEFQTLLAVAKEKADNALGAVNQACGEGGLVDSARVALENVSAAEQKLPEMIGQLEVAIQELGRYGAGF